MAKSDSIQYLFLEIITDPTRLTSTCLSMAGNFQSDPKMDELREQLLDRVMIGIDQLTSKQKQIITMYFFEGKTQCEIANHLGTVQPSVFKSMYGNDVYKNGNNITTYGGSIKKLKKWLMSDPATQNILEGMAEQRGKEYCFTDEIQMAGW